MSAPQTNIEKQKRRHSGPLIGMALVTIFGFAMVFFWMMYEASNGANPSTASPASDETAPAETMPKPVPAPGG